MKYKALFKKGDITLLVTLLVCGIILALLTPFAQRVTVESNISRENLMSQQAIQAANTGLGAWEFNIGTSNNFDNTTSQDTNNFPNSSISNPQKDGDWIVLDGIPGNRVLYKVVYYPPTAPDNTAKIIATGRVEKGSLTIDRALEKSFASL